MTCYLDMDGVLVDFTNGAFRLHNTFLAPHETDWDFCIKMGFAHATDPAFWGPMDAKFWANLDWTVEGRELLDGVEKLFGNNVVLLTAPPPGSLEATAGKIEWVRKHLPQYESRLMVGKAKHLLAGPRKILVDDNDTNVFKFNEHGGSSVLVPRPWNSCKHQCVDGNHDVESLLQTISMVKSECL
jgi:5' nucleotidase, deoxy (Pyrimidine), cytosolic type C protein (NT5C)